MCVANNQLCIRVNGCQGHEVIEDSWTEPFDSVRRKDESRLVKLVVHLEINVDNQLNDIGP